jgi:hypothetical protein
LGLPHGSVQALHQQARQQGIELVIEPMPHCRWCMPTDAHRGIEPEHVPNVFERFYRGSCFSFTAPTVPAGSNN